MKALFLVVSGFLVFPCFGQQQTFDIVKYTPPTGWKKEATASALQFSKENSTTGGYCIITVFKALPSLAKPNENFDAAWESVVKEMVKINGNPEMQPGSTQNGWEAVSGFAPFESEGQKGIALLITSSGSGKMINILVLTNTNVFENELTAFLESVKLPESSGTGLIGSKTGTSGIATNTPSKPVNTGFSFNTTNFDDGWTSTVQEDWVEVKKGNTKVLIHHPNKNADAYNSVLMDGLKNAWNILVANRYSSGSNFEFKPVSGWQSIEFAEADLVEKGSGKTVHVVLFKMNYSNGSGRYMEFITENKRAFEATFGAYHTESYGWEKMENMVMYNKFAVGPSDLRGKWTNNFSGLTQYVNANTGASAGADTHSSSQIYAFAGNTYQWNISMASGFVGNIKFKSTKSSGKFSMTGNWQVNFSDIEGKPRSYPVYFTCIKGARILWIDGTGFGKIE